MRCRAVAIGPPNRKSSSALLTGRPIMQTSLRFGSLRMLSILGLAIVGVTSAARAQSDGADGAAQNMTLTTVDGQPIAITYYPAIPEKNPGGLQNAGVIVLLHGDDKGRILWDKASAPAANAKTFPVQLQDKGFAVITVDLRKFGDSKPAAGQPAVRPIDYELMAANDLAVVKRFIYEEHQQQKLNMNKTAIVAVGPTAPVAATFAAADWAAAPYDDAPVEENKTPRGQDVRALVLLSPDSGAGRMATSKSINFLRNPQLGVALLVIVGQKDSGDKGQAKKLYELMETGQRKDETPRVYMLSPNLKDRGLGLIGKMPDAVEAPMIKFLDMHVAQAPSEWRDRADKVTRK